MRRRRRTSWTLRACSHGRGERSEQRGRDRFGAAQGGNQRFFELFFFEEELELESLLRLLLEPVDLELLDFEVLFLESEFDELELLDPEEEERDELEDGLLERDVLERDEPEDLLELDELG